jgi:hypothetical protein
MTARKFAQSFHGPRRAFRQQELLIKIRRNHPLQPAPPGQRLLPVMMQAPHKERADRSLRQTCGVDGPIHGLFVQTLQEWVQRREGGHAR